MKNNKLAILLRGIITENPVLILILGTCPTLAVTGNVTSALSMGIAATIVLICSNIVISALRKVIPDTVRVPCYIVIIATFLYRRVFKNEITESLFFFTLAALLSVALLFVYKSSAILSLLLAALITGSMHAINLMLLSFVPKYFAKEGKVATVTGLGNAFSYLGSTVSSYGIAVISAKLGWSYTFISWGSVALTGALFCIILLPIWNRFRKNRI